MAKKSINEIIGEKIQQLRHERGMSQMAVAIFMNVSYQQMQKYEKATGGLSIDRLEQLSAAFKIPINDFFTTAIKSAQAKVGSTKSKAKQAKKPRK